MDRAERRRRTDWIAHRRKHEHDKNHRRPKSITDRADWALCFCGDVGLGFWATHRPYSCGCSSRQDGRPRVNRGMCSFGRRNRIYRWRAQVREINQVLARGYDPDDDPVAVLASAESVSNTGLWQS